MVVATAAEKDAERKRLAEEAAQKDQLLYELQERLAREAETIEATR
jgi:hypothetical protein